MTRRKAGIAWLALALALCWAFFAARPDAQPPAPIAPQAERDFLRAELRCDAGTRTLRGTQTISMTNRTADAIDGIVLRALMNGADAEAVTISAVTVGGQRVPFAWDEDDRTLLFIDYDWAAQTQIDLAFTIMVKYPKTDGAAIVMLPCPAMYEAGAWRTDAYDPLAVQGYAQPFDYTVTVDGEVAAQMRGARDAGFALALGCSVRQRDADGVRLCAIAPGSGAAGRLADAAEEALSSLAQLGLAYPFDALTVAVSDTGYADGLALSGLAVLGTEGDREALTARLTRLIARQTFGVLVGSDPWNAPWLSVSLASAAEMLAYRQERGAAVYAQRLYEELEPATRVTRPHGVCVGASSAHFGSSDEMTQVLRDEGAAMLLGIEQAVGGEAFLAALHAYIAENSGKTGSQESLLRALESETGSSWAGYLLDGLGA